MTNSLYNGTSWNISYIQFRQFNMSRTHFQWLLIFYYTIYAALLYTLHLSFIAPHLVLDTPHHMTFYRDSPHLHINWNTLIYSFFDTAMRLGIPFSNSFALLSFSTIVFILVHCIIRSTNHSSWCVMIWYMYTYHQTLLTVGHFVEEHVLDIN